MGLKIKNPFIKGNIKDFLTGESGGRIGSPARIIHRLSGTKEEKQKQARRLGGAVSGAVGGFLKGGPWGAAAGAISGAQSDEALTGQRILTEGGKGYLAGSAVKGAQGAMAAKAQASALGAGRGLTSSGGARMADQGGTAFGGGSKLGLAARLIKRNSTIKPSQDDGVEEYNNQLLTDTLRRMRQSRERKYFGGGNNG